MDVAFKDLYFDICTMDVNAMIMEQFRSFKPGKPYWITETGAGMCGAGRPAHPGQFNAWLWSSFAHGGDAHVVFRWRTCLSGQEQDLEGMLEHSGIPGHRYQAIKKAFLEMRMIAPQLGELPLPVAETAFVHDYETMWGYQSTGIGGLINYEKQFCALYREFYKRNVRADIVPPGADLSRYKLVVLPSLVMVDESFAKQLKKFVEGGGVVLAHGQLAMMDMNIKYLPIQGPDHLQDVFGVLINGGMYLYSQVMPDECSGQSRNFNVRLGGKLGGRTAKGVASTWLGDLEATDARVLLKVEEDVYAGQPAVVEKATGKGLAVYSAATRLDDALIGRLVDYVLTRAGISPLKKIPEHVEVIRRGAMTFVINHLDKPVELNLGLKGKVFRGSLRNGKARLKPYDILIVKPDDD
jgi:beta-galactosidase